MPVWLQVVLPLVTAVLGYLGHYFQAKTATKDNTLNLADARRAEALGHLKWAAELAVSGDEGKKRLGVDQLTVLSSDPNLEPDDLRRVRVAIRSALHPRLEEITRGTDAEVRSKAPGAEEEQ
ncbi:MAG: hypothetical protein CYG60_01870 [Actinobacteria bacterium]|nr:MAG: hypothetical protein CYG60_01870 [Actinomycetota bacterium]